MDIQTIKTPPPFTGLRVIELAEDPGGEYAGRLLAEMGAEVLKLEPVDGPPSRKVGPWAGGVAGPETSLNFRYYNTGKKSVLLEVGKPGGVAALKSLTAGADIFITTLQ